MDAAEYFQRIKYTGSSEPSLETLTALQQQHLLQIPFENLDIHNGVEIRLDIERIYRKIIQSNRGGFCYELNGIFYELLRLLGYKVKRIGASVYSDTSGLGPIFDHLTSIVEIEGVEYLSDVGFGAFPLRPLPLLSEKIIKDPMGEYRIDQVSDVLFDVVQVLSDRDNKYYQFDITERKYHDFSERCHYQQTAPDTHFTRKRLISQKTPNGRITITGDILKITSNGKVHEETLEEIGGFEKALLKYFNIVI